MQFKKYRLKQQLMTDELLYFDGSEEMAFELHEKYKAPLDLRCDEFGQWSWAAYIPVQHDKIIKLERCMYLAKDARGHLFSLNMAEFKDLYEPINDPVAED